ncbi:hypothetical protein [Marinobacterium marinum]|uniref:Uncharacterized protein n=1 Tax=Marinobacterium marinum TaxID=2756129 RepID=A0A7W1WW24_9GAMM|nr:hypothetical protein [Marinobacterium marinum]MBA4501187.1 hypothetical protein [Marinobacterium marinum]
MYVIRPCVAMLALLLAGCNAAAPTQPAEAAASPPSPHSENASTTEPRDAGGAGAASHERSSAGSAIQSGFDQISGRLTLLQEQVLQLRSDNQTLLEQNQMLLNRLQLLTAPSAPESEDEGERVVSAGAASEQLDAAIGQLMQMLNQMDMAAGAGGQFAVTTTYTRQGDWVLLRYDRHTGETWQAKAGRWLPLADVDYLNTSSYRVLVHRADQDSKGYVAVRIDEQGGMSWWLNGDRWQEYAQ